MQVLRWVVAWLLGSAALALLWMMLGWRRSADADAVVPRLSPPGATPEPRDIQDEPARVPRPVSVTDR